MIAVVTALKQNLGGVAARSPLLAFLLLVAHLATAEAQELLRIAIATPLSGPHARIGAEIRTALEIIDSVQPPTSATPAPILTWHDDLCSASGGASAATALAALEQAQRPHIVIGHACPSAADAAEPIYAAAGLTFLAAGRLPGNPNTQRRATPKSFRLPADGQQAAAMAASLAYAPPTARIGFVRDRTQFATQTVQAVQGLLAKRGRPISVTETFNGGDKDFTKLAERLKTAGITHIAVAAFASEASLLVLALREALGDVAIIATDTLADPNFARVAGRASDGVQVALPVFARGFGAADTFAKRYEATNGSPISGTALATAATYQIAAMLPAGDIAAALRDGTHQTILSTVTFDAAGDSNIPSHIIVRWEGGQLVGPGNKF